MSEPPARPINKINGKVIVAGRSNVGKTCLVERFVNDVYAADDPTHSATIGVENLRKKVNVDANTEVDLFIYDTAGQERFADMATSYYRVGEVCLLCFDMSDMSSFDMAHWWMKKVQDHNDKCSFILIGTKEDLTDSNFDTAPVTAWCEERGIQFFPTSAKKGGANIKFLFHTVAEKCVRLSREKQLSEKPSGGDLRIGGQQSAKSSCC